MRSGFDVEAEPNVADCSRAWVDSGQETADITEGSALLSLNGKPKNRCSMTRNEIKGLQHGNAPIVLKSLHGFADFWHAMTQWSEATFGDRKTRGPIGPLKHLAKEAQEAWQETDLVKRDEEIADCLFLVIDAANRAGMTASDLLTVAWRKLEKNKARTWPKSVGDEPTEHLKGGGE